MADFDFLKLFYENGIELTSHQYEQLQKFETDLVETNKFMNLTAITEHSEVWIKHFFDSIVATKFVKFKGDMLDLGTGAGFPGIPLKIMLPNENFTLVDSLNKRIDFLKRVINSLELTKINAFHGRAEDLGLHVDFRENYDFVLSRAVASLNLLAEYCMPFTKVGGLFVSYKGSDCEEEISQSKKALSSLGGKIDDVIKYELPIDGSKRTLVIVKKVKPTSIKYPRKPAVIKKNPL